jgi:sugar (pentulose or hexulose) kinase
MNEKQILIIDIGKTHVKLHVLNSALDSVFSKQMKNIIDKNGLYPSVNITAIWRWLMSTIKEATSQYPISTMSITTHGATAALINRNKIVDGSLVLPILDYEYQGITEDTSEYTSLRPDYCQTFSPNLPAGLNLGRQLYWLKKQFPDDFANTTDILMYPQYWAWRFTGERVSEITSLGCHTDLWSVLDDDYSSLVDKLSCRALLPEILPANTDLGSILPELRADLGLSSNCHLFSGIHDSNASFLRYRLTKGDTPFTVVSTGTWTIVMATQVPLENLVESKDMLANVDATGKPIACARFMGGREFEAICEQAGSWIGEKFDVSDLQAVIDKQVYALPNFSEGSGPFGYQKSQIIGPVKQISGIALASIYCALMIDYQLDMLEVQGDIFIEGAFLKNPILCSLLSQLRDEQKIFLSKDSTGTVQGAAYLTRWNNIEN